MNILYPRGIPLLFFFLVGLVPLGATCAPHCEKHTWPDYLAFLGLESTESSRWHFYIFEPKTGKVQKIPTEQEPRTFAFSQSEQLLVYAAEDGTIRRKELGSSGESVLLESNKFYSYGQPSLGDQNRLYLVRFKEGASTDTEVVSFSSSGPASRAPEPVVTQPGAIFSPVFVEPYLYYTVAHCVEGCGNIIQEVWRKHLQTGIARQLTLTGLLLSDPEPNNHHLLAVSLSEPGSESVILLSTEKSGQFNSRIFQARNARYPVVDTHGNLLFLSYEGVKTKIILQQGDLRCEVSLPDGIAAAREMALPR